MERKTTVSYTIHSDYHNIFTLASMFNDNFSIDWIFELSGEMPSHVLLGLEEGIKRGWIKRNEPRMFHFSDAKVQKTLQDYIPPKEKIRLHRRIANMFIIELPENDEKAMAIAHHLLRVPNDETGCNWLIKGGDACLNNFRNKEAMSFYNKVLDDLKESRGDEADELFIDAAIKYSKIATARSIPPEAIKLLKDAMARAKHWDKKNYQVLLYFNLAKYEWLRARYNQAFSFFETGWSMAKLIDDPKLLGKATTFSTFILYWQGRFREAVRTYENAVPDIEKYPNKRFPLLAATTTAYCYVQVGNVTQGLGMLDSILSQCEKRGDRYLAANAGAAMGLAMLSIGRNEDAVLYVEKSINDATETSNNWISISSKVILAYCYYLMGMSEKSISILDLYLKESKQLQIKIQPYPYLIELCWAIHQGRLPRVSGLSIEKEIRSAIRGKNIHTKGAAYRYKALLQRLEGLPHEKILRSLNISIKCLESSGHQIEHASTLIEMARQYLLLGDEEKAQEKVNTVYRMISPFNEGLIPENLKFLVQEPVLRENFIREILKMSHDVVTIRENKDLLKRIVSTSNRLIGAERGAIFLIEKNSRQPKPIMRASNNLTLEQITHKNFQPTMKMIERVGKTGKSFILDANETKSPVSFSKEIIRSQICLPMILRNTVVGVLYHDNSILNNAFKESDMEVISYFAAQAAFAMDNAQAYEEIKKLNQKLKEEKRYFEEQHLQSIHFDDIYGESPAIKKVLDLVIQVAPTDTTVLITGETGVGKELIARAIHRNSSRRDKPFIVVNCSALPESLIPSELFGHEKGAFTGATQRRIGRFELADEGTIFLDEVSDLSLDIQVRLLRVLQSKEFERVGGTKSIQSDFRVVLASNRGLEQEVQAGRLRADFYYRINVFPVHVPPLRERKEDIPMLAHYFLKVYSTKTGNYFEMIDHKEIDKLMRYDWPGNVRELENMIERGIILSHEPHFQIPDLYVPPRNEDKHGVNELTLKENERRHIQRALEKTNWKVRGSGGAAELLDIHPSTLEFRMKKLGIKRPAVFKR